VKPCVGRSGRRGLILFLTVKRDYWFPKTPLPEAEKSDFESGSLKEDGKLNLAHVRAQRRKLVDQYTSARDRLNKTHPDAIAASQAQAAAERKLSQEMSAAQAVIDRHATAQQKYAEQVKSLTSLKKHGLFFPLGPTPPNTAGGRRTRRARWQFRPGGAGLCLTGSVHAFPMMVCIPFLTRCPFRHGRRVCRPAAPVPSPRSAGVRSVAAAGRAFRDLPAGL
jgi:hypothetical protein